MKYYLPVFLLIFIVGCNQNNRDKIKDEKLTDGLKFKACEETKINHNEAALSKMEDTSVASKRPYGSNRIKEDDNTTVEYEVYSPKRVGSPKSPVRFVRFSETRFAQTHPQLADAYPGFDRWMLIFDEVAGEPPYTLVVKRLAQKDPAAWFEQSISLEQSQGLNLSEMPICACIGAWGFLPGEQLTWRLLSKDKAIYREITACPRPLILKKLSGELLLEAKLDRTSPTQYTVNITNSDPEEEFDFISQSVNELVELPSKGSFQIVLYPEVIGVDGDVNKIELRYKKSGESYKIELPWGTELLKYLRGEK